MEDATNPDYYKFPNGSQAIDITRYLTSNAGQAVQYVARATRTDGKVKGEPVQDIQKAIWFLSDELERMQEGEPSAAEHKAQVALDQGEPYLAAATHLAVKWLGPADECQVAPGWLLKDSFDWDGDDIDAKHQHLKQLKHSEYGWVYAQCNEFGEEGGTARSPMRINFKGITFPITIVKQKEKK